jgi:hypothetical protein
VHLANDNGSSSLQLNFWLGAGTNLYIRNFIIQLGHLLQQMLTEQLVKLILQIDTANDWYITGVQLEAGTTASDFEFLPVDVNLNRCQRYFELIADNHSQTIGIASCFEDGSTGIGHYFVTKRTVPTLYQTTGTNYYTMYRAGVHNWSTQIYLAYASKYSADLYLPIGTTDQSFLFLAGNASSKIALQAEL